MSSMPRVAHDPLQVVIAGGGVAALEVLVALQALSPGRINPTVIAPSAHFTYRPLLVGEPFGFGPRRTYGLDRLCGDLGANVVRDRVVDVDTDDRRAHTATGITVGYDVLVIAIGARSFPPFQYGITFDREAAPEDFDEVLWSARDGYAQRVAIVVPDGVTWTLPAYELALLTAADARRSAVTVITHEPAPLAAFGATAAAKVGEILAAGDVELFTGAHADVVTMGALRARGAWIETDRIVALPGLTGQRLAGVPADDHGYIPVDRHGRVEGLEDVYAAGDGTTMVIKQGGLATQQADAVASHVAARVSGAPEPPPWRPVLRGLLRTAGDPYFLRAEVDRPDATSTISRQPLWWPPSKIASRWLSPHLARLDAAREPLSPTDVSGRQ